MSWIEIFSLGVSAVSCVSAAFFWNRATSLHQILENTVAGSDEIQNQLYRAQGDLRKKKDALQSRSDRTQKLELQIKKLENHSSEFQELYKNAEQRRLEVENRANILIERYKDEFVAAEKNFAIERARSLEVSEKLHRVEAVKDKSLAEEQVRHKETARVLKKKISEQNDLYQNLQGQVKKIKEKWVDPSEHLRLKKKIAGYQRVCQVLKGQKDMAEEKLENWHSALLKLSHWVLKHHNQQLPDESTQCVLKALDVVHIGLVQDEFTIPQPKSRVGGSSAQDGVIL
ncbi:MAG: hypothetical protein AB8C84_06340 [Oligoflexales bacterium]